MKKQLLHALLVLTLVGSSAIASSDTAKKIQAQPKRVKLPSSKKIRELKQKIKMEKKRKRWQG